MATTGIVRGKLIGLYIGGTLVSHGLGCSIEFGTNMLDFTDKDSGDDEDVLPELRNARISFNGRMAFDATYGVNDLVTAHNAGTGLTAMISTEVTGDNTWSGTAYIESLSVTADFGSSALLSFTLRVSGGVTPGTVSA